MKTKTTKEAQVLPTDSRLRKNLPLARGLLAYFPEALAYVSFVSRVGNDKHRPGKPIAWERGLSDDHEDAIIRHTIDVGEYDDVGILHTGSRAWRALAALQLEIEARGGLAEVLRKGEKIQKTGLNKNISSKKPEKICV